MVRMVCIVLAERIEFFWCTHNMGIMLSRDSLVNDACRILVRDGGILNFCKRG
jgi:hypothetical protein